VNFLKQGALVSLDASCLPLNSAVDAGGKVAAGARLAEALDYAIRWLRIFCKRVAEVTDNPGQIHQWPLAELLRIVGDLGNTLAENSSHRIAYQVLRPACRQPPLHLRHRLRDQAQQLALAARPTPLFQKFTTASCASLLF